MKREVQKRKADLTTLRNPTLAGAQRGMKSRAGRRSIFDTD